MRVLPILFQSSMVRAILREVREPGTGKTETRRIIKPETSSKLQSGDVLVSWPPTEVVREGARFRPRWRVGDLLYVREGFHFDGDAVAYMADHPGDPAGMKWRPSIHLPRAHSRLTLKVTAIRVQRLHDITDAEAIAEGIECRDAAWGIYRPDGTMQCGGSIDPVEAFRCLWINVNGTGAWDVNPWVVAISFWPRLANVDAILREAA